MRSLGVSCDGWGKWIRRSAGLAIALLAMHAGEARAAPAGAQRQQGIVVQRIARPPNLVIIIGDDHGWPYAGFMGDPIVETPNLDEIAAGGTVFTHMFASASVCRPSLQTLLTGLNGQRWSAQRQRLEETLGHGFGNRTEVQHFETLPRQLARRGYRSFEGGKYWEGSFWMAGFDAGTTKYNSGGLVPFGASEFGRPSIEPMLDFLDEVEDEPFFLWVAPMLPHLPLDPPPEFRALYEGRGLVPTAVLYYANITRLDHLVGEVVAALEERRLRDDTLVVYVSDNGWEQAPDRDHFLGPLVGGPKGKVSIYELGHRAPAIFNWPGHVPPGRRLDDLASFEDLHATFLDYARVPLPPDHIGFTLRGRIEGHDRPSRDRIYAATDSLRVRESEHVPGGPIVKPERAAYVRTRRWRYISYVDRNEHELYRIDEDPFEDFDVAPQYPGVVEALAADLDAWLNDLGAPAQWMDVTGELRILFGPGIPGATLVLEGTAEDGSPMDFQVATAQDGSFRFPNVPAGNYLVRLPGNIIVYDGQILDAVSLDLTRSVTAPRLLLVAFSPPASARPEQVGRSEIAGWVEEHRGDPAVGIPVEFYGRTAEGEFTSCVSTGPDGGFVLDRIPAGFYLQWLRLPRGVRATVTPVHLPSDSRAETFVRVRRGHHKKWWPPQRWRWIRPNPEVKYFSGVKSPD